MSGDKFALVEDTFAEAFPMFVGRVLITGESEKWALEAARTATGFASSIIMSPAEAGIEGPPVPPDATPDGRPGVYIQVYHRSRRDLKLQMITRIGQCVLTCPTACAFDGMPDAKRKLKVGAALRLFGDGFEKKDSLQNRTVWKIPVMEGEFTVESRFGVRRGVAGGNLILMGKTRQLALQAAEKAVEAIRSMSGVVLPFPAGICRSGSKVGAMNYKLPASTNHLFCPILRLTVEGSAVPAEAEAVYEIIFNGLSLDVVTKATSLGLRAALATDGIVKVTAVNFGGKLGPYQIKLRDALSVNT